MSSHPPPGQSAVLRFLAGTADDYDRLVAEATGGWDHRWKRWMLDRMRAPRRVLDLASGTGILSFQVLERFPDAHVTGIDMQDAYLAIARTRATAQGLGQRLRLLHGTVEDADVSGSFDHVVSCYLAKYADRDRLAARLATWCAPGARVLLHDFAHPTDAGVERALRALYDRWMARVRTRPQWTACFEGLYDYVRESPWVDDLPVALRDAGFHSVTTTRLGYGCAAVVEARWPG